MMSFLIFAASAVAVLFALYTIAIVPEYLSKVEEDRRDQRHKTRIGLVVLGMLYVIVYIQVAGAALMGIMEK